MKYKSLLVFSVLLAAIAVSCSKENASGNLPTGIDIEVGENSALFILNQGAWPGGSTLDLKNLSSGAFSANWFAAANPDVTQGLGNTGNDMAVIGGKLWALMNGSNQIAIINPSTGKLEKVLDVDSPRYIVKKGDYAYVTSYGAAINGSVFGVKGKVYRINPTTYEAKTVEVGYQPEGLTVLGDKLYVANSGGYQADQENTISVIDLSSFTVTGTLELPVKNLNRLFSAQGKLWVTTYDCYNADWSAIVTPASLGSVTPEGEYTAVPGVTVGMPALSKDKLYNVSYAGMQVVDAATGEVSAIALKDAQIGYPYGLAVHPVNGELYIADASFTGDSRVLCFAADGTFKWSQTTGIGTGPMLVY
jgi:glutamine cyclotransferase